MFDSYEFTFAGISSYQFGLMIYDFGGSGQSDVAFGNKASIVEQRIANRVQPLHFGVNYHESPLQFKIVFGAEHPLTRYELEEIGFWLTGYQDYQWLTIDQPDLAHVRFRCIITQLTPKSHGWLPVAFEATVMCDCPYAYSHPFSEQYTISGTKDIIVRNNSSTREYIKPELDFIPDSGVSSLEIINHSDGDRSFRLDNLPVSDLSIHIDNANGIIVENTYGYNLYDGFNLNFFRLVCGDNNLTVSGNGILTISGMFLHNVAG